MNPPTSVGGCSVNALKLTRSLEGAEYKEVYTTEAFNKNKRIGKIIEIAEILKKDIDEEFDFNDYPSQNIAPDISDISNIKGGAIISGMDPEAIKNPDEKLKYIKAIEENHKKIDRIRIQGYLRKIEKHALWIIQIELKLLVKKEEDFTEISLFFQDKCDCSNEFFEKVESIVLDSI